MERTLRYLAALVGGELEGDPLCLVEGVCSAEAPRPRRIGFVESPGLLPAALASDAGALLVRRDAEAAGKPLVRVDHPKAAFARIVADFHPEPRPAPGVHPSAVVHDSATLGEEVSVGPHAVVEQGAVLGDRAVIGPGCVVGAGARIGEDSRLFPRVTVYPGVTLGARVRVHAGAVLGSDGFGYVTTPEGVVKFPQVGTLIVGDDAEIGANATIDRGALDATTIGAGVKIDNLVQVAHNVAIGPMTAVSAQTGIAGTSRVGARCVFGGQVGVGDHVTIGDDVTIGAQAGILPGKRLPAGGTWWGTPVRPIREAKQISALLARLPKVLRKLRDAGEPRP